MTEQTRATAAVVDFITNARWQDFPAEAIALGKRCIIDGLGVVLAGSTTAGSKIIHNYMVYRRTCAVNSRNTESPTLIRLPWNELWGAPARYPTATIGPREVASPPSP